MLNIFLKIKNRSISKEIKTLVSWINQDLSQVLTLFFYEPNNDLNQ